MTMIFIIYRTGLVEYLHRDRFGGNSGERTANLLHSHAKTSEIE